MKTLSLFAIAMMFATAGMAQKTTDSSSINKNKQWKQNSNQPKKRKKDTTYNHWNNKNRDSSDHGWPVMDSTKNYDQYSPNKNMNQRNKENKMNKRQKADKLPIDSI